MPDPREDLAAKRASLDSRLRLLEEERDRLLMQLSVAQIVPSESSIQAAHAPSVFQQNLDGVIRAVGPVLGILADAREMVLDDHAAAERQNDPTAATQASLLLRELEAQSDELQATIAKLATLAASLRASISKNNNPG